MKNILILDDNKDILQALHLGLCACLKDCAIQTALNGEAGMTVLKNMRVDLIVTDLDMPVQNGYQFIKEARHDYPKVPMCVMSGSDLTELKDRLLGLGVTQFIRKPFLFEDLANLITTELNLDLTNVSAEEIGNA